MCLYALEYDRKSDTGTSHLTTLFSSALEKCLEYSRSLFLGYPGSGIAELEHKARRISSCTIRNISAAVSRPDRVRQEIIKHRTNFFSIGVHSYVADFEF